MELYPAHVQMREEDFALLRDLVFELCGINLNAGKKTMLEARLQKRLRELSIGSYRDYYKLLRAPEGAEEIVHMIDAVTTNKTEFFREADHFQFLETGLLPDFWATQDHARTFAAWSAACSSGEESYSLAMVLDDFAGRRPGFTYSLLATDISTKVLAKARLGIYDKSALAGVPEALARRCLLRAKAPGSPLIRVIPQLRAMVDFQRANLMDPPPFRHRMDVIFCCNAMIYFNRETQHAIIKRFVEALRPGGYLFLGHSEALHWPDIPLARAGNAVYRKRE